MQYLIFIVVAALIAALVVIIHVIINKNKIKHIVNFFRGGNVIVAGHKGNGKDMLFSLVIREREKNGEIHSANIKYTDKTKVRDIKYLCLCNNSIKKFMTSNLEHETKLFTPKEDYYISEAGLSLPNWGRTYLEKDKNLSTLPITFALSRHLGEFNIHANAQEFIRIWDKLREQADILIYCERCRVIGRSVRQQMIVYDRLESALSHIQPLQFNRTLFGRKRKEELARAMTFNAKYGYIERFTISHKLPKKSYIYDTRAFYKKFYGTTPPPTNKKGERKHHRHKKVVETAIKTEKHETNEK